MVKRIRTHRTERRAAWIAENGPCAQCGSTEQLEVDHIDPALKDVRLKRHHSARLWDWTESKRLAELANCQVLCKRCHKIKSDTALRAR